MRRWNVSEKCGSCPLMFRDISTEKENRNLCSFWEKNVWGLMLIP